MVVANFVNNGIGTVVLNYSRELVRDGGEVTVFVGGPVGEDKQAEADGCGISVVQLPSRKKRPIAYLGELRRRVRAGGFDIVHVHGNSGMVLPDLLAARANRVVTVACHCHNTGCEHPVLHRILKRAVPGGGDILLACSEEAGRWLYGDAPFTVLPNAFDTARFSYSEEARASVRAGLGIPEGAFVLGDVARLNPEKNHAFLIGVFEELRKRDPDARLVIAGDGPGRAAVEDMVAASPARGGILMLGDVPDPSGLYSALDAFVFPSIHEGLGIVLVEAQIAGLGCWVSDDVPAAAGLCGLFHQFPLADGPAVWAERIQKRAQGSPREELSRKALACAAPFDIANTYGLLRGLYEVAVRERKAA